MIASASSRKRVYVACRAIFSGDNAHIRKQSKVKKLLEKHNNSIKRLLEDLGDDTVVSIALSLLGDMIFESEIRAKAAFPDLFQSSPTRSAQREACEADATSSVAEALDDIASQDGEEIEAVVVNEPSERTDCPDAGASSKALEQPPTGLLPSLFPSYLPYQTQHLMLSTCQRLREECCFDFASTSLPSALKLRGWECPSAGELTKWTKIFRKSQNRPPPPEPDFDDTHLLKQISNIRHIAVHRVPITARATSQLLASAVSFAQLFDDQACAAQLRMLQSDLDGKIKALELHKDVLESNAQSKLQDIQRKREDLNRQEAELIEEYVQDDRDNRVSVGQLLEDAVQKMLEFRSVHRQGGVEVHSKVMLTNGDTMHGEQGSDDREAEEPNGSS